MTVPPPASRPSSPVGAPGRRPAGRLAWLVGGIAGSLVIAAGLGAAVWTSVGGDHQPDDAGHLPPIDFGTIGGAPETTGWTDPPPTTAKSQDADRPPAVAASGAPAAFAAPEPVHDPPAKLQSGDDEREPAAAGVPARESARPTFVAVASLPPVGAGALGGGPGDGQPVDLGACPGGTARRLMLDLAVPADGLAAARPRLAVERMKGDAPTWTIRWAGADVGLGDEVADEVGTIAPAEGRFRMTLTDDGSAAPAHAVLARSVLIVGSPGTAETHEIRFVKPVGVAPVHVDLFGPRPARAVLRLPAGFGPSDLLRGDCCIDLEVAGAAHRIEIAAGATTKPVAIACPVLNLANGVELGLRVEFDPNRATLAMQPAIAGAGVPREWLAGFADLAERGEPAVAQCLDDWNRRVTDVIRLSLDAAVTKQGGDRIDALFKEALRLPGGYAPVVESLQAAFGRHLAAADGRFVGGATPAGSFDAWRADCLRLLAQARQGGPLAVMGLRDEWGTVFERPLSAWWAAYRQQLAATIRPLVAELAAARARAATVKVRVVLVARTGSGAKHDVPLTTFDESPSVGDNQAPPDSLGLD